MEKELLAKIIDLKDITAFGSLNPDFLSEDGRSLYNKIKRHIETYKTMPSRATLKADLPETPEPLDFYKSEFTKYVLGRQIENLQMTVATSVSENDLNTAIASLKEFTPKIPFEHRELKHITELGNMVLDYVKENRHKKIIGIPSGWDTLDEITQGFKGGDVILVLARPKMGKTMALIKLADAAIEAGYPSLFVSMEMTEIQIALRYIAYKGSINMTDLRNATISSFAEARIKEVIGSLKQKAPLYVIEGRFRKTIGELESIITTVNPAIVFIDGGYLLKIARSSHKTKWELVSDIAESIKNIALNQNIPIVVSFQFNRQVNNKKEVGTEHIQLADTIGQIASVAFGIFDDDESGSLNPQKRIEVFAARDGVAGKFLINWNWERMNFTEVKDGKTQSSAFSVDEGVSDSMWWDNPEI